MTAKQLHQIYHINNEIKMWQKELERLRSQSKPKGQRLTGMPNGSGTSDTTSAIAIEIAQYEAMIEEAKYKLAVERAKIMKFINGIDDSYMRQIIFLRDVSCLPWDIVAAEVGGDNTADGIRMMHKRFLKKLSE